MTISRLIVAGAERIVIAGTIASVLREKNAMTIALATKIAIARKKKII